MLGRPLPRMASCYVPAKHIHCDPTSILPRERMEKQENGNEMEIGNGNWRKKWKQSTHQNTQCFLQCAFSLLLYST